MPRPHGIFLVDHQPQPCSQDLSRRLEVSRSFIEIQSIANVVLLAVTALEPIDTSSSGGGGTSLTISDCEEILTDAHLGDSIAVNGILLFVYNTWDIV
jgi:hypothetical protein